MFDPYRMGGLMLANRIVMAPLTRNRAGAGNVATALTAEYYAQRADAGLIVAEASQVCPEGQGYQDTPGIHSEAQVGAWKTVTDAVHARGGKIFLQLWHVGRISHVSLQPNGQAPVAPSAIRANSKTFVNGSFTEVSEPRALRLDELPGIVAAYRKGAANAIRAGFDGVEIHGANGYLLDQFLRDGTNKRTDDYGGSIENRARLMLEVTAAIVAEIGAERTGIRLSPVTPANDASDSNPQPVFNYVVEQLDKLNLVYIHVIEGATGGDRNFGAGFDYEALHKRFRNTWIVNNGYTLESAQQALAGKRADLVAFGRPFISNPDLVARLRHNAPLAPLDRATLYGGGAKGYTDYPVLEMAK
ncbi:alkene reductase [Ferrovibrio sp.]|uniref:alkene reductase n=1 Tax=Ferrovibrio sp. TaxID=1917215 RepID=UPI00262AC6EA|nr:alkene reductase [Ferrovibrio sp.]